MFATIAAMSFLQGCAIHYFDSKTGTENIWGFGHMQMKATVAQEGVKSVVRGTDFLGVGAGWIDRRPSLIVGWDRGGMMEITDPNASICLEWPDNSLFNVRIGTNFPPVLLQDETKQTIRPESEINP